MSAAQKSKYGKRFVDCVVNYAKETGISMNVNANDTVYNEILEVVNHKKQF